MRGGGKKLFVLPRLLTCHSGDPGPVGILVVGGEAKQLDVVVAQLGDGAPAPAAPAAVERVGRAGGDL